MTSSRSVACSRRQSRRQDHPSWAAPWWPARLPPLARWLPLRSGGGHLQGPGNFSAAAHVAELMQGHAAAVPWKQRTEQAEAVVATAGWPALADAGARQLCGAGIYYSSESSFGEETALLSRDSSGRCTCPRSISQVSRAWTDGGHARQELLFRKKQRADNLNQLSMRFFSILLPMPIF